MKLSYIIYLLLVLIAKIEDSNLRFYIDYRKLNKLIRKSRYLLLLIEEVLARIEKSKYLIRLDIIAVFNQLRIYLDSED